MGGGIIHVQAPLPLGTSRQVKRAAARSTRRPVTPHRGPKGGSLRANEIVVDNFAGGGGASTGIKWAIGRDPDVALNHDAEACWMYRANHPGSKVLCQSVWQADPVEVADGKPVGIAWFSPDCADHSKAKGAAPIRSRSSRDLAWVIVHWAKRVKPRIILMENVEEWLGWGPLRQRVWPDGSPMADLHGNPVWERDPDKAGQYFKKWLGQLRRCGYKVEWRELRASKYGAPTIRKRLFLVARCDGDPIVWPAANDNWGITPYRTAADCIDWSVPCPSIFERKKELAEATCRRIARGIMRYVVNAAKPFIVPITHHGDSRVHSIDEPLRTVTTAHRGELAVVSPILAGVGGRAGQSRPRAGNEALHTTTAKGDTALVAAKLAPAIMTNTTGHPGAQIDSPMPTLTTGNQQGLIAATLIPRYGERPGQEPRCQDINKPTSTIVPTANGAQLVAAFLAKHYGGHEATGQPVDQTMPTIVTRCTQLQAVSAFIKRDFGTSTGSAADEPIGTITTEGNGHATLVSAFMQKYYSVGGQDSPIDEGMHTLTAKARMGLVTVTIEGESYVIVDIGMRMLAARELFNAQGFPADYVISVSWTEIDKKGRTIVRHLTKTAQIRMCGNSVCPPMSRALVAVNLNEAPPEREAA